ncbi:hypothetical protein tb265_44340 [Gemmatimonadetes bacterium T265]|nr:hypothetical protein tb265_44340 [Gemmatimonadetes bacterium T265]
MTMSDPRTAVPTPDQLDDDLDVLGALLDAEGAGALGPDADDAPTIPARAADAPVPMSFAQELLWLLDRATPGLTAYNLPVVRRLRGALDVAALGRALTLLAERHELLRARFADEDGTPRLLLDAPGPVALEVVDLGGLPEAERPVEAERVARARARAPFDLAREHPFRATVVRLAGDDQVLVLASHHIALDGWSLGILYRELAAAYDAYRAGADPALPPVRVRFGDYATWQRGRLSGARLDALLGFWRGQLGDAVEPLALPTDFPRPAAPTFAGARETLALGAEASARVRELARRHGATPYMVLLTAYATVLHRYTGRDDVLVGSGSAGRGVRELEGVVGYLNNTLVQRANFAGDPTFAELLARVRASALDAYDHQEIPLEKLVLELRHGRERLADAPLFEVVLTMQETGSDGLALDGLRVEPFGVDMAATKFDVTLLVGERDGAFGLTAQYRSDLFAPATMGRFLGHVRAVLDAAAADDGVRVSRLPMLTAAERADLPRWNATAVDEGAAADVVSLFDAQAVRVAGRTAVVAADATLTYAELRARADALAGRLLTLGVGAGARVGLLIDRSAAAVVGLLGVLKAGAAYVPLPADAPPARVAQVLAACGAAAVVADPAHAGVVAAGVPVVSPDAATGVGLGAAADRAPEPGDVAYVLHTSGSTGTPKGVEVTHANLVHYVRAISRVFADVAPEAPGDGLAALDGLHVGMASTFAADLGYTALFPALLAGATLHVLDAATATEPARFGAYAAAHPLDVLKLTPGHLRALAAGLTDDALAAVLPRRWLVLGGEALAPSFARALVDAGPCRVLNHYGPTEATVGACTFEVTPAALDAAAAAGARTVPVGRPLPNVRAYVADPHGGEQPVGVPGELVLAGAGIAHGYTGRADLTGERFGAFPRLGDGGEPGAYRTGDRVRRLADGALEFLGRVDEQVKVRGYRVEPGEVAHALRGHPGLADAAVVADAADAEPRLTAYVVPRRPDALPNAQALAAWLGDRLPSYMVPAAFVTRDRLPLTANGKIDRARLPAVDAPATAAAVVAPRTETERQLAAVWQDVLKREAVGVAESFLALGGHSLLAIRVLGRISKQFGVRLPLRALFEHPTVAQLAELVDAERQGGACIGGGLAPIAPASRDAFRIGAAASVTPANGTSGTRGASA